MSSVNNVFDVLGDGSEEVAGTLLKTEAFTLERIVSYGQSSPEGFWYEQERDEWVCLLRGSARLVFADGRQLELAAGDYLHIAAACRHRVENCSSDAHWLALHYCDAKA
ncbi:cupin domain-containing protein [Agaribacterium haliotis]|uniref:cupin domain-containing protein n=1 Tax=Agaribacterium haliotis TaxID=2013869 RepID=UPI00195995D4|nr:cupin domain-containing protein [Agaribacterium haliotis]